MHFSRWLTGLVAPLAWLALPMAASAQTVITDDAYVSTNGQANFGGNPNLDVSATKTTYLKFQLAPLPDGTRGSAVERATLKLFLGNVIAPGRLDVSAVADAWNEAAITGLTAPPPTLLVATTDRISVDARERSSASARAAPTPPASATSSSARSPAPPPPSAAATRSWAPSRAS